MRSLSANKEIKVIAFKLTHTDDQKERELAIAKIAGSEHIDFVVHNDLQEISVDQNAHAFNLFKSDFLVCSGQTKTDMAVALNQVISE